MSAGGGRPHTGYSEHRPGLLNEGTRRTHDEVVNGEDQQLCRRRISIIIQSRLMISRKAGARKSRYITIRKQSIVRLFQTTSSIGVIVSPADLAVLADPIIDDIISRVRRVFMFFDR